MMYVFNLYAHTINPIICTHAYINLSYNPGNILVSSARGYLFIANGLSSAAPDERERVMSARCKANTTGSGRKTEVAERCLSFISLMTYENLGLVQNFFCEPVQLCSKCLPTVPVFSTRSFLNTIRTMSINIELFCNCESSGC